MHRHPALVVAGLVSAGLLATACTTTSGAVSPDPDDVVLDLGFGHVHELQSAPGDDIVYAATHYGLWRLQPGVDPQRVGDSARDVMGFTIAGPAEFLGSGHPDPRSDGPTSLGLIRSTDAGVTWDEVSLGGEVDFHSLTVSGSTVYGWDALSGTVLRSADGGSSFDRAAALVTTDLLVNPDDPAAVLAATPDGLQLSTDSGRSFTPVQPPPPSPLVHLGFNGTDSTVLTGMDADGAVWVSTPDGWQSPGALPGGEPVAFTATPHRLTAATSDAVLTSSDAGATWSTVADVSG